MNEKDKWSAHLEYCKVVITLATALLGATAVIFADPTKMPRGDSRYFLLSSDLFFLCALTSALFAIAFIGNMMINTQANPSKVTWASGAALGFLFLASASLSLFFFCRVYWPKP